MKKKHLYSYLMKEEGLSQSELARDLGVTRQAISMALKHSPKGGGKIQRFLMGLPTGQWYPIPTAWSSLKNAARRLGIIVVKNNNLFRRE